MSQSLLLFVSLCAVSAFVLAWVVIYPWVKGSKADDNRLMAVNVESFYERLAELEVDKEKGVIDENFYQNQVVELKRQLLAAQTATPMIAPASIKSRLIVLVWIPILGAMVYMLGADRTPVFTLWQAQDTVGQVADDLLTAKIDTPPEWAIKDSTALISAMQTNVHHNAHDAMRWMRLSELFMSLKANPQALEALARAYRLEPDNQEIASTYAQVAFFSNEGKLDGTIRQILAKMLTDNPKHEGAMMLLAMGETRAGNFEVAQNWVGQLRTLIASKSGDHSSALESLDKLSATIAEQADKASQGVAMSVQLEPSLLPQVDKDDTVFVSISDIKGGPPYAVKKLPISELKDGKLETSLSNLDAMMPERTLEVARKDSITLVATARISKTGNAISSSGDLSANPVPISNTTKNVEILINQRVP